MLENVEKNDYSGSDANLLVAVNPRESVLRVVSDRIIDASVGYNGDVYRADNVDRIHDVERFYDVAETVPDNELWYDESFLFDDNGFSDHDLGFFEDYDNITYVGGPLEDLGIVFNQLKDVSRSDTSHRLFKDLVADFAVLTDDMGYIREDGLARLNEIIERDELDLDRRFRKFDLEDLDIF